MLKRVLFAGAIVGVVALMGYGVLEAVAGEGTEPRSFYEGRRVSDGDGVDPDDGFTGRGTGQGSSWISGPTAAQTGGWGRSSNRTPAQPYFEADLTETKLSGVVVALDGSELLVQTAQGEQVTAGLGKPSFWESQGLALQPGDEVQIRGFWEAGEFEVSNLTLAATGQTVVLRDASGRPQWAGGGRWASPNAAGSSQSF